MRGFSGPPGRRAVMRNYDRGLEHDRYTLLRQKGTKAIVFAGDPTVNNAKVASGQALRERVVNGHRGAG